MLNDCAVMNDALGFARKVMAAVTLSGQPRQGTHGAAAITTAWRPTAPQSQPGSTISSPSP